MIYYLHIKGTEDVLDINGKWIFKSIDDIQIFFSKVIPDNATLKIEKKRWVTNEEGIEVEETYIKSKKIAGNELICWLDECMNLIKINEKIIPNYVDIFPAEIYDFKEKRLLNEPAN